MSYSPTEWPGFGGGLNLADPPRTLAPNETPYCSDVLFRGDAVQSRYGYSRLTSSALTNPVASLAAYEKTDGTIQLLAGCGTRLEALAISSGTIGSVVASATGLTDKSWDFARFGAPGSELAYAANPSHNLRKWDGSAWASVSNSPACRYVAVMAVDQGNRMVAAGFDDGNNGPSAAAAKTSQVWFSNAGDPETWGANNYQQLTPGDGEAIQNVIAWRELVFVFKETKFFVFYGTSTDASGNPIFNYRTVDAGVGLASPRAVAVAPDGVYFMARDGVYLTTGGDPVRVSDNVGPVWSHAYHNGYSISNVVMPRDRTTNAAMEFYDGLLFLAYTAGVSTTNNMVLVHNPSEGWWTLWPNISASCFAKVRVSSSPYLVFGYASGSNRVGKWSTASDAAPASDAEGTTPSSSWISGYWDCGVPDVKTIREMKVEGEAHTAVTLSVIPDDSTPTLTASTTLETDATHAGNAIIRKATRATKFQVKVEDTTSANFTLNRAVLNLREKRVPSID